MLNAADGHPAWRDDRYLRYSQYSRNKNQHKVFCCAVRKGWKSKEKYVMLKTNNDEKIGSIERGQPFWVIGDKEQAGEEMK